MRKQREVAQTRGWRLFNKNTGLCELGRGRIGADACPVPEGYVEVLGLRLKAPKLSPGKRRP